MTGVSRCALALVLTLTAGTPAALAQALECYAVRRGDTASQLARRITGDARNKYEPWFQIVDPATRFVPKSQYERIRPGWRACIVKKSAAASKRVDAKDVLATDVTRPVAATANPQPAAISPPTPTSRDIDFTAVWLVPAVLVAWLGWRIPEAFLTRRKKTSIVMRHFAQQFVREFERPLIQQNGAEHPVESRLRLRPFRARLEILLAPGDGRRYPNLSDHRKNVEYDVVRVMHVLADDSFVCGPLYVQAEWVVVPFQFRDGPKQPGVACISSY